MVDRVGHAEVNAAGAVGRHGTFLRAGQQGFSEVLPGAVAGAAHPHLPLGAAARRD